MGQSSSTKSDNETEQREKPAPAGSIPDPAGSIPDPDSRFQIPDRPRRPSVPIFYPLDPWQRQRLVDEHRREMFAYKAEIAKWKRERREEEKHEREKMDPCNAEHLKQ